MTRDRTIAVGTLGAEFACMVCILVTPPDRLWVMVLGLALWCDALVPGVMTAWRATCRDSGWPVLILVAQVFMLMLWVSALGTILKGPW
jgi:hypothetical protein